MRFEVIFEGEIKYAESLKVPPADEFSGWVNSITIELMKLSALTPSVGGSAQEGTVDIRVMADVKDADLALSLGGSQIRASAHAAGLATPGWEVHWVRVNAEPEEARPASDDDLLVVTT